MWGATSPFKSFEQVQIISIHAPRVGSDRHFRNDCTHSVHFNPRSPCGERLTAAFNAFKADVISIHAPRVGSDAEAFPPTAPEARFQSTLPVWGATHLFLCRRLGAPFQSTLPVWGATVADVNDAAHSDISIHAPRVESDVGVNT